MTHVLRLTAAVLCLASLLAPVALPAHAQSPGQVRALQKISATEGGLAPGTLALQDGFGSGVASIGDVDDDGVPDAFVGARSAEEAYVLLLNADGTVKAQQPVSLGSDNSFGSSATGLGDLDGDGVPDVAVGAPEDDAAEDGGGAVYVLLLNTDGTVKDTQKISATEGGLAGNTLTALDQFGSSVAALGDLDGDGVTDMLVGAPRDDDGFESIGTNAGAAYVLFLNTDGTVKDQQKISATEGGLASGTLDGGVGVFGDFFGFGAAGLGDFDGDGVPDVLVGAPGDDDGEDDAGAAYVLFLNADGTVNDQQKLSNAEGGLGDDIEDADASGGFGSSAAALGDLDGDGVLDVLVGAPNTGADFGAVFVLFLNADGTVKDQLRITDFPAEVSEDGLPSGTLEQADSFGSGVATLGDLDGDDVPEVIVGTPGDDDGDGFFDGGAAYVLFLNNAVSGTISGPRFATFGDTGITINFADGTSGSGTVSVARFSDPPDGTGGIPSGLNVSSYRIVITAEASLTIGDGSEVIFDLDAFGGTPNPDDIRLFTRSVAGEGNFAEITDVEVSGGELTATVSSFSEFVFASATNPLPVELASFTARAEAEDVVLAWQTLSETANAGFAVEQRAASGPWTEVGYVQGAGTTTEAQTYTFRASNVGYGARAFRLRQVDLDGTATLSETVHIETSLRASHALAAYPNPARAGQGATVDVTAREAQQVTVEVFDVLGRRVATLFDGEVAARETERLRLRGAALASGVYLVRATGERFTATRRITVVR